MPWVRSKHLDAERQYISDLEGVVSRMAGLLHSKGVPLPPFIPQDNEWKFPIVRKGQQLDTIIRKLDKYEDDNERPASQS